MAEPMRPAMRIAIITGASSLAMEMPTMPPTALERLRSTSTGPVCSAMTAPMKNDNTQTINRLALPISKNCSNTFCRCRQASGRASIVRQNNRIISPMFSNIMLLEAECRMWKATLPAAGDAISGSSAFCSCRFIGCSRFGFDDRNIKQAHGFFLSESD